MASCLVPDFPAVMVVLEHLKELDKQLKEEEVPYAPEASLHLAEVMAAITDLEAERHAAHEHLEVETIENSKLRHQINNTRERMSHEIMADVAAARVSNAAEIKQLHKDLNTVLQLQEDTVKRQEALLRQNEALHPQRDQVKADHEEIIAPLNEQITLKYGLQIQLDQTQEQIEELESHIAAVQQDKITLEQNMERENVAFKVKKDNLSREMDQADEKIKQWKQAIRKSRRELDRVDDERQETQSHLGELMADVAKLQSNLQRLRASRCQFEKQLGEEPQKQQELREQMETLKKDLCDLRESYSCAVQDLKEEIATVEGKIKESRASRLLCQDTLAQIHEIFKQHHEVESEVRAEHFHVSQQLERSKLQLEERIASIVQHRKQIKEMDRQVGELLEADTINQRLFQRSQEELCGNMDTEKKNVSHLQEERDKLRRLLEEERRRQEEHVAQMTSDISSTRRRYEELRREEAALRQRQPQSTDADSLKSHMSQCEIEFRQMEIRYHQEIQEHAAETESIAASSEEKQRELAEKEAVLREREARWSEEQGRHQRLTALTSELSQRKTELELSIQRLREETSSLLQPREEMKAELEERRGSYMDVLKQQASELRAVEISFYNSSVNLEQVRMENSRMHLSIKQMTEDVSRARRNEDRCWQEMEQLSLDIKALFDSLQEAWREDLLVTQDRQKSDRVILMSLSSLVDQLKTRRQQLGNVSVLLHQQMLDFSKRLGDKTTEQV